MTPFAEFLVAENDKIRQATARLAKVLSTADTEASKKHPNYPFPEVFDEKTTQQPQQG